MGCVSFEHPWAADGTLVSQLQQVLQKCFLKSNLPIPYLLSFASHVAILLGINYSCVNKSAPACCRLTRRPNGLGCCSNTASKGGADGADAATEQCWVFPSDTARFLDEVYEVLLCFGSRECSRACCPADVMEMKACPGCFLHFCP